MSIFKSLREKNNKMWAKLYSPQTKIARKGKWYCIAPAIVIALGAILAIIGIWHSAVGFNWGLDFTGGSVIETTNVPEDTIGDAKSAITKYLDEKGISYDMSTPVSDKNGLSLVIKYQGENEDVKKFIIDTVKDITGVTPNPSEEISASASGERVMMTFISIAVTLIAILIYLLFRFKFTMSVATVIGLIHDAFVVVALMAIFHVQINYSFVAALITLIVYSLNNTIILFDRIRGKEKALKASNSRVDVEKITDESVKETFARTMGTTITTLIPVIVLCCLPVTLIREFALPIMFALIAGTFSTIFVTTALYVRFENFALYRRRFKEKERALSAQKPELL